MLIVAGLTALATLTWFGVRAARDAQATQARVSAVCPRPATIPAPPASIPRSELATSGQIFASHAWSHRVSIVDLATGKVTSLPAGIGDAHEVGVSPDGRWGVAADFGNNTRG